MVWSCILFVILWVLLRYAAETLHPFLIIFYRSLFGLLAMAPFFRRERLRALKTDHLGRHFVRGITGTVATFGVFYAVTVLPLADLVAITYAAPIFATVGAVWLLGEQIRLRRVVATVIGFLGVLVVIRPGYQEMTPGLISALIGTVAIAGSLVTIKLLTRTEHPQTIVAYSFLFVMPSGLIASLFVWRWPTLEEFGLLLVIGFVVSLAQTALARAFLHGEATAVMPFDFVRLILAGFVGALLFNEPLDVWTWAGASIILGTTIYMAHREAQIHRRTKAVD